MIMKKISTKQFKVFGYFGVGFGKLLHHSWVSFPTAMGNFLVSTIFYSKLTHPPSLLSPTCNLLCFIGKLQLILQNNIKLLNFFYQLLQPILNLLYVNTTIISRYERIKKLINFKIKSIQEPFKRVLHFLCMFVYVYLLRVLDVYVLHVHVLSVVCVASTFVACKCVYFCTSIFN